MRNRRIKQEGLKRVNPHTILFNDREKKAITKYCDQYSISNRSKFMREIIITAVLKKFDEDYPSLFEEEHPTLFSRV